MSRDWRTWLADKLSLPIRQERIVERVVERPVREAKISDADQWRSLQNTERDLTPIQHDRHLEVARNLATTHPVAKRALEIHTDLVVSDGIEIKATSKDEEVAARVQKLIDEFREVNEIDLLTPTLAQELSVSGELNVAPFVRAADGRVRIGLLLAEDVDCVSLQPHNALKKDALKLKLWSAKNAVAAGGSDKINWKVINRDLSGKWVGDEEDAQSPGVFVLQINNLPASTRGFSDLLPVADWLDRYHQGLHSEMDRMRFMKTFVWDVELTGADAKGVDEWAAEHKTPPRPGSVLPHNEREKWTPSSPSLGTQESLPLLETVFKLILGCLGVPIHFYASGEGQQTLASAKEMSTPVMAKVRRRQELIRDFYRQIVDFAIQCAREAGRLQGLEDEDCAFEVLTREPDRRQIDTAGKALLDAVSAYSRAQVAGYITAEEAGRAFRDKARAYGDEFEEEDRAPVDPNAVKGIMGTGMAPGAGKPGGAPSDPNSPSLSDNAARPNGPTVAEQLRGKIGQLVWRQRGGSDNASTGTNDAKPASS